MGETSSPDKAVKVALGRATPNSVRDTASSSDKPWFERDRKRPIVITCDRFNTGDGDSGRQAERIAALLDVDYVDPLLRLAEATGTRPESREEVGGLTISFAAAEATTSEVDDLVAATIRGILASAQHVVTLCDKARWGRPLMQAALKRHGAIVVESDLLDRSSDAEVRDLLAATGVSTAGRPDAAEGPSHKHDPGGHAAQLNPSVRVSDPGHRSNQDAK